jgi:hypothetical protein
VVAPHRDDVDDERSPCSDVVVWAKTMGNSRVEHLRTPRLVPNIALSALWAKSSKSSGDNPMQHCPFLMAEKKLRRHFVYVVVVVYVVVMSRTVRHWVSSMTNEYTSSNVR